jgi:polysaccharide biosynthesis protein PslH
MEKKQGNRDHRVVHLLSLVWYRVLPAHFGGQKGIALFNKYLARHHRLSCLCSNDNQPSGREEYNVLPLLPTGRRQVLNPFAWMKIKKQANALGATHLILEHPYYLFPALSLQRRGITLIAHSHNIEYAVYRSRGKMGWRLLRWMERKAYRTADLCLFKTEEDRNQAVQEFSLDAGKCLVIPYGLDRDAAPAPEARAMASTRIREQYHIASGDNILYFNGTLDYAPNAEALQFAVDKLLPELDRRQLDYRFLVSGRIKKSGFEALHALHHPRYLFLGELDDVDDLCLGADLFLNPVHSGGGIKVKTMEALACGLPVVASTHASMGIDLDYTGSCLRVVHDNAPEAWALAITEILKTPAVLPPAFYLRYQWTSVLQPLLERLAPR